MSFNLLLDLLTCYSGRRGQKLSMVFRLSGWTTVNEVRRPQPLRWEVSCTWARMLSPLPHLPPSTLRSASRAPGRSKSYSMYCPQVLQSSLSFSSLYLGAYAFWKLELLEQRHLGSLETEAGTSLQRGLGPWPQSPE